MKMKNSTNNKTAALTAIRAFCYDVSNYQETGQKRSPRHPQDILERGGRTTTLVVPARRNFSEKRLRKYTR